MREVQRKVCRRIGEQECNILGECFREESGERGESVVHADSDTRDGAIGKDDDSIDRVDMLLNLGRNTLLVKLVLMNTPGIGQPRRVKDANLRERSHVLLIFTNTRTYQYAVLTRKFVNTRRVCLTFAAGTISLVVPVEDIEVVVIKGFTKKNIGDEF